jgi:hypothetical protein
MHSTYTHQIQRDDRMPVASTIKYPMENARLDIFALNLKTLINKKKITYVDLAEELHLDKWRVKRWLTGKCFPQHKIMVSLCDYFGYKDIYSLLTKEINPKDL